MSSPKRALDTSQNSQVGSSISFPHLSSFGWLDKTLPRALIRLRSLQKEGSWKFPSRLGDSYVSCA
jgi:hypothetical protein